MFYEFQVPDNLEDRLNHSASPLHKAASFQGKKQLRVTDTAIGYIIGPFWLSGLEGWTLEARPFHDIYFEPGWTGNKTK